MASEATPREWHLQHVARVIADNNGLSHDWPDFLEAAEALDKAGLLGNGARVEYASEYKSGDMRVYIDDPDIEAIAPLAGRIAHDLRNGCHVYRRRVAAEDWERVGFTGQRCDSQDCLTCARPARRHDDED